MEMGDSWLLGERERQAPWDVSRYGNHGLQLRPVGVEMCDTIDPCGLGGNPAHNESRWQT